MSDITMCTGEGCPLKNKCYRYTAHADPYWQSYFMTPPYKNGELCAQFWENEQTNKKVEKNERKHD